MSKPIKKIENGEGHAVRYVELRVVVACAALLITIGGAIHASIASFYAGQATVKDAIKTELKDFGEDIRRDIGRDRQMFLRELDQLNKRIDKLEP